MTVYNYFFLSPAPVEYLSGLLYEQFNGVNSKSLGEESSIFHSCELQ